MKKFSKFILESKNETREMSSLTNPVDWEEIFKPLIEHIENNLQSKVQNPGSAVFTNKTRSLLDEFIDQVEEDYKNYFRDEIHDGSQESFAQAFKINVDYRDINDCILSLTDRTDDVEEYGDFDLGSFVISIDNIKYNTNEEIVEDLFDVHGKLKMLNTNFTIFVTKSKEESLGRRPQRETVSLTKDKADFKDLLKGESISHVQIFIYNKDTVTAVDLD